MKKRNLLLASVLLLTLTSISYAKCGDMQNKPMMGKCGDKMKMMQMKKDQNSSCDSNKSMKSGKCGNMKPMPKEMPMMGKCGKGKCGG